ncbi:MAG: thiolase domain-containing protein [Candidatus Paceibacterota bacterium]|jgi:acetyl-CoA C-acetyltransferase
MRKVAIVGVGCTEFGELWDKSFRDLFVKAGADAVFDAGIQAKEIEAMYIGNMSGGRFIGQEHIGALVADYSGLANRHIPSTHVEAACASGGLALRQAIIAVGSGCHDIVIAGGVEKMTDVSVDETTDVLAAAADREGEGIMGATFPGLYALIAQRHMFEFGTTREQLASVAVKNHHNATMNPKAQFRSEITVDMVLKSVMVADPLHILDCSPITDGAAAVVVVPADQAKKYTDTPVYVKALSQASGSLALHDRPSVTTIDATVAAAKGAYKMAGLGPKDISFAEVHDCFTIAEICAIEDLGFTPKGIGGKFTEEGCTAIGGKIPINTSGGLKAKGHPVGATGIAQAIEAVLQFRGEAGKRQLDDPKYALTQNVGGSGATVAVHIFGRDK